MCAWCSEAQQNNFSLDENDSVLVEELVGKIDVKNVIFSVILQIFTNNICRNNDYQLQNA